VTGQSITKTTARIVPIGRGQRRFSAMFKPVGSRCNLDCRYCYYLGKEARKAQSAPVDGRVLETFIRDYINAIDDHDVYFEWQGGEPTLLGIEYFRTVLALQRRHCPPHKRVFNSIQTNGTLLDEEWCSFLADNGFLVGLSIDGPRELHDYFRVTSGGEPTFDAVMGAASRLTRRGVEFSTLTVVNSANSRYPLELYRFLTREVGPRMLQFIPCVELLDFRHTAPWYWRHAPVPADAPQLRPGAEQSLLTDWSVSSEAYGAFLCAIFDEWHEHDIGRHFVNIFESAVASWAGLPPQICVFNAFCGKSVMVEQDGDVYSCDHFAFPEYRLGNIAESSLGDLVFSQRQVAFGYGKLDLLPGQCRTCRYLKACYGECPKKRFLHTSDGEPGLNYLCKGLYQFFRHADQRLQKLAVGIAGHTIFEEK
jgi:uncharacterized protein